MVILPAMYSRLSACVERSVSIRRATKFAVPPQASETSPLPGLTLSRLPRKPTLWQPTVVLIETRRFRLPFEADERPRLGPERHDTPIPNHGVAMRSLSHPRTEFCARLDLSNQIQHCLTTSAGCPLGRQRFVGAPASGGMAAFDYRSSVPTSTG